MIFINTTAGDYVYNQNGNFVFKDSFTLEVMMARYCLNLEGLLIYLFILGHGDIYV